ncbi:plasma membrane iron permease [Xylariaceae sp. FL1019]|nr:plasma membrane iron permease [Xylariaceae sp. FL1019]
MTVNVFAVPVFFITFRESLETAIIVSVLLSFLTQSLSDNSDNGTRKKLVKQVWLGVALGLLICLALGAGLIATFYTLDRDYFSKAEYIWEGVFGIISSLIISITGAALLRVNKMQAKWSVKLTAALDRETIKSHSGLGKKVKAWSEKYFMFLLPFITVLREGLEAVVFIGGVSLGLPATSFPLAVVAGLAAGSLVGYLIYKGGNRFSMQIFLIISTCFLYLVAAGLFSRAVWYFEANEWNRITGGDAAETGSGPGSYDITKSVWHVNCCNPELNGGGGWGIFNALFGWQNSATYGSVISYNVYWIVAIVYFGMMAYHDRKGNWGVFTPVMSRVSRSRSKSKADETESHRTLTARSS